MSSPWFRDEIRHTHYKIIKLTDSKISGYNVIFLTLAYWYITVIPTLLRIGCVTPWFLGIIWCTTIVFSFCKILLWEIFWITYGLVRVVYGRLVPSSTSVATDGSGLFTAICLSIASITQFPGWKNKNCLAWEFFVAF